MPHRAASASTWTAVCAAAHKLKYGATELSLSVYETTEGKLEQFLLSKPE